MRGAVSECRMMITTFVGARRAALTDKTYRCVRLNLLCSCSRSQLESHAAGGGKSSRVHGRRRRRVRHFVCVLARPCQWTGQAALVVAMLCLAPLRWAGCVRGALW